jgi:hypothetical protein
MYLIDSIVKVKWEDEEVENYIIVSKNNADKNKNKISYDSPFAKSLIGKNVGDIIEFIVGDKINRYELMEIVLSKAMIDSLDEEKNIIKNYITSHGINYLVHFTNISNIKSILDYGLLSVDALKQKSIKYECNDKQRLDKKTDCICCSVEFPNFKFMYTMKNNHYENFVIVVIDVKVLLEKECFCSSTNAAANYGRNIMPINKFEELFKGNRSDDFRSCYPTDVQSEILVKDIIETRYIKKIVCKDGSDLNTLKPIVHNSIDLVMESKMFKWRKERE